MVTKLAFLGTLVWYSLCLADSVCVCVRQSHTCEQGQVCIVEYTAQEKHSHACEMGSS